ncbi:MAG TPA: hydrogenase expression/formation protein HypE, partial [Gemmatales bacterium]|nr:hydrogenase expression/formation protein HypE [Gemmatales bacterium]
RITLAHGEGGRQMRRLLETVIHPLLGSPRSIRDAAHFQLRSQQLALTTDSFVVSPLFFPGGDIGKLAVHGTVNDLAVSGAIPRYLSLSLILEEGLPLAILEQVIRSIARAAQECEVEIITGDTKVVPRGDADGIYINTTGLGEVLEPAVPGPTSLQPGDALLVTGPVGRHGIAILTAREQLDLQPLLESDVAPLWPAVQAAHQAAGQHLRAMRDATRGGVTAVLHEWAMESKLTLSIQEQLLPVHELTRSVCEVLGLEPLHLACEGTMLLSVSPEYAEATVSALRQTSVARQASIMGYVQTRSIAPVTIRRLLNREQSLEEPSGSPLPRIC